MNVGTAITFSGTTGNATYSGIVTASSFIGDGSSLSNLPAGAPVGGASTNTVFFENDKAVAVNYQITSTKNAMSAVQYQLMLELLLQFHQDVLGLSYKY